LPLLLDALQAPFQKINLQRLLTDLALQLRHLVRVQPPLARAGKRRPGDSRNSCRHRCKRLGFTSNARATAATEAPDSSRSMASSLNSRLNFRRDNPMFASSIRWVLSLNSLSQKWGQVQ
jgi:hypothetical protein